MNNLESASPFTVQVINTPAGTLTTLVADHGVSNHDVIRFGDKTLLANYVYAANETYSVLYTVVDQQGQTESFREDQGILPTLFISPTGENFAAVVPYHPDKEQEIFLPVWDRNGYTPLKPNKPGTGNFSGTTKNHTLFYETDIFTRKKPDKLTVLEFKDGAPKKRTQVKVEEPIGNKVYVRNAIHLLGRVDKNTWLHREIDEKGITVRQRALSIDQPVREVLQLSWDTDSYILSEYNGRFSLTSITPEGISTTTDIIDLGTQVYNTWPPVTNEAGLSLTRFNTEHGNGWITLRNTEVLEVFYRNGGRTYANLRTQESFTVDDDQMILSGINTTGPNSYAATFYPLPAKNTKNKKLLVFNRKL